MDIHRIIGAAGELRNLDQALIETEEDISSLNSSSPNLKETWTI
jgi:hypothetical protein